MISRIRNHISAFTGIALTLVTALIAYITGASGSISFLAALLGVVISLQVDFMMRFLSLRTDLTNLGSLTEIVFNNSSHIGLLTAIVDSLKRISSVENDLRTVAASGIVMQRSDDLLTKCKDELADLARGSFASAGYDFAPLNAALLKCQSNVRAVTVQGVDRLITGRFAAAKEYMTIQRELVRRGVNVERIFVYRDRTSELAQAMEAQDSIGVTVYEVPASRIGEELMMDMAVVDNCFYGGLEIGSAGGIITTHYSVKKSEIERAVRNFEQLRSVATEWTQ